LSFENSNLFGIGPRRTLRPIFEFRIYLGSEKGIEFMTVIIVVHVLVCVALILIVLLQAGKGAEMGAAFGGASQTIFGSAGAMGFLSKLTTIAAIIFMITSLLLTFSSTRRVSTIMKERPAPAAPSEMPVQPQVPVPEPKK
jgi:preprotein translocase subunit SecG